MALFHGKMNFLQSYKRIKKKIRESDWTIYWPKEETAVCDKCNKNEKVNEKVNMDKNDKCFGKEEIDAFQEALLTNLLGANTCIKEERFEETEPVPEKELQLEQVMSEETEIVFEFDE